MSFLDFLTRSGPSSKSPNPADLTHLTTWTRTHHGVEAFIEPRTTVTDVTAVLVAHDGEWTRRVVGERGAHRLSATLNIPVYDVRKVGYPQRMRDHDARKRIEARRDRLSGL